MEKKISHKKVYRLSDEQERKVRLSIFDIFLRAVLVFVFVFVMLCTVFVSAAKLPVKVAVLSIPRGGTVNIAMPLAQKNSLKTIELCRGLFKSKCSILASKVVGVKKTVVIPASYPLGDGLIKVSTIGSSAGKPVLLLLVNKKVKIIAAKTSGGGGGGGGGSGSGGSGGSGSSDGTISLVNGGVSSPTPVPTSSPVSGGTIIRATPTPTPPLYNTKHPVLINH